MTQPEIKIKSLEIYLRYVSYISAQSPKSVEEIIEQAKKIEKFICS